MDTRIVTVITLAAAALISTWLWTGLAGRAHERRQENIHQVLDQIDHDMGIQDSKAEHALPATQRIQRVMDRVQQKEQADKALIDSLARVNNTDMNSQNAIDTVAMREQRLFPDVVRD